MRACLRERQARRMIFLARFECKSRFGDILLKNLVGPGGITEDHVWIRSTHWRGHIPAKDDCVAFEANIEPYFRKDGSKDWSLFRCEEVRL